MSIDFNSSFIEIDSDKLIAVCDKVIKEVVDRQKEEDRLTVEYYVNKRTSLLKRHPILKYFGYDKIENEKDFKRWLQRQSCSYTYDYPSCISDTFRRVAQRCKDMANESKNGSMYLSAEDYGWIFGWGKK